MTTHNLSSADRIIFSPEIRNFCYIKKCRYRLCFYADCYSLNVFYALKGFFNKHPNNADDFSEIG